MNFNLSNYEVKEIIQNHDDSFDDFIKHLSEILNDRSIPEEHKHLIQKQYDEIMKLKNITMKPPTIVLSPKKG